MRYITTGTEMQRIDSYTMQTIGIPSMVLMERAALAVTQVLTEYIEELELETLPRVLVVTEGGNNGGDGLAVARMLLEYGCEVDVYQIGGIERESEQYSRQKAILNHLGIVVKQGVTNAVLQEWKQPRYDIIVDGIFGIGLHREIESPHREVIAFINSLGGLKCAIDMPSGIDSTTGELYGIGFQADVTVTFGCEKTGQLIGFGPDYCGDLVLADIGFPKKALQQYTPTCMAYEWNDLQQHLPKRIQTGNKGTFGKVAVVAGSASTCGAALLSAEAAYRTGCGLVMVITHENNRTAIQKALPEALLRVYSTPDEARQLAEDAGRWADVMVVGPGIGTEQTGVILTETVLKQSCPVLVDADAITIVSEKKEWWKLRPDKERTILTPHMKEMERISQIPMKRLKQEPWTCAKELARLSSSICVLKDARTVVAEPDTEACYMNLSGNDGMATGGSGDVLTGIIAALAVQGLSPAEAARTGVYLHGLAGDRAAEERGNYSMLAGDLIAGVEAVLKEI